MEMVLSNGFCEMSEDDILNVAAGGWADFVLATGGVLCIAYFCLMSLQTIWIMKWQIGWKTI